MSAVRAVAILTLVGSLIGSLGGSSARAEPRVDPPGAQLPSAVDCARCHADIAAQWASSAHRHSSFDNPYYRVSVEAFRTERGRSAARFCAGCHEPVLFLSGAIDGAIDPASAAAQAGVGCLVCHAIDTTDLAGNGGWHAKLGGDVHGQRAPILAEARLCAACHKVGLRPDITHDRWIRGQDDWDAWLASSASGNGASAVYRAAEIRRCQDCHMPLEPAVHDAAAKNGMVRSHRFLGANSALAHLRGDDDTEQRIAAFLGGAVALDLFLDEARGEAVAVLANRRVGHRFPGGTNDSNEVWLEVTAFGAGGAVLGRSGARDEGGVLDADAHLVRAQPVDGEAEPLRLRDPQHMRGVAFDTSLGPGDPQAIRFALPSGTTRVEARLLYRKFSRAYAERACSSSVDTTRCRNVPTVEIAHAAAAPADASSSAAPAAVRTLVERALALAGAMADSADRALSFVDAARALAPDRPEPLLARARAMLRLGRTDDAALAARAAARLDPRHPAAAWLEASALDRGYRQREARPAVERLLRLVPADRAALALGARVFGVVGDARAALGAADRLAAIDPDLEEAHFQRALALADLGRLDEAQAAEETWLSRRVFDEVDLALRRLWCSRHPERPDESEPVHVHRLHP
jgi:hypothetical protein